VWLNGSFVGAAKDSRLPSEWEVTHLIQPTGNLLAVQVSHNGLGIGLRNADVRGVLYVRGGAAKASRLLSEWEVTHWK
jgi:hypothetical protein